MEDRDGYFGLETLECVFCFNVFEKKSFISSHNSRCLYELCCNYMHSLITKENRQDLEVECTAREKIFPFCPECSVAADELSELTDKLESFQRNISKLVFIFSLDILNRRKKKKIQQTGNRHCPTVEGIENDNPQISQIETSHFPTSQFVKVEVLQDANNAVHNEKGIDIENDGLEYDIGQNEDIETYLNSANVTDMSFDVLSSADHNGKKQISLPTVLLEKLQFQSNGDPTIPINTFKTSGKCGLRSLSTSNAIKEADYTKIVSSNQNKEQETTVTSNDAFRTDAILTRSIEDGIESTDPMAVDIVSISHSKMKRKSNKYRKSLQKKLHSGQNAVTCPICKKEFVDEQRCNEHHRIAHNPDKPFVCRFCGRTFTRKTGLKFHERNHTGEKPYKCSACDKRFAQKYNLRMHMRTHTGERPYQCPICEIRLTQHSIYKEHMKVHSTDRPYECEHCGFTCKRLHNLKSHQKQHFKFKCKDCDQKFASEEDMENHYKSVHIVQLDFDAPNFYVVPGENGNSVVQ